MIRYFIKFVLKSNGKRLKNIFTYNKKLIYQNIGFCRSHLLLSTRNRILERFYINVVSFVRKRGREKESLCAGDEKDRSTERRSEEPKIYCKIISYLPTTFADVSSAAGFSPRLPHYF